MDAEVDEAVGESTSSEKADHHRECWTDQELKFLAQVTRKRSEQVQLARRGRISQTREDE